MTGCTRRWRPMFSLRRPERLRSAGVWMAPHPATTARERTVTRCPSAVRASTPRAAPPSTMTRWARVRGRIFAPAAWACPRHEGDALVLGATRGRLVEHGQRLGLGGLEVGVVEVGARFEHDH